jgi:hypothetical protein
VAAPAVEHMEKLAEFAEQRGVLASYPLSATSFCSRPSTADVISAPASLQASRRHRPGTTTQNASALLGDYETPLI